MSDQKQNQSQNNNQKPKKINLGFRSLGYDIARKKEEYEAEHPPLDPKQQVHLREVKIRLNQEQVNSEASSSSDTNQTEPDEPSAKDETQAEPVKAELVVGASGVEQTYTGMHRTYNSPVAAPGSWQEVDVGKAIRTVIPILSLGLVAYIAIWGVPAKVQERANLDPAPAQIQSVLFTPDDKVVVAVDTITRSAVIDGRSQSAEKNLRPDTLYSLEFTPQSTVTPLNGRSFVNSLHTTVAPSFVRTLKDPFVFGFYINKSGQTTNYLALEVFSFEQAYLDMLAWEKRKMVGDLRNIIHDYPVSASNNMAGWQDAVVKGHDIRVLTTLDGKDVLAYGFVRKNTLVIAGDRVVLEKVLSKIK